MEQVQQQLTREQFEEIKASSVIRRAVTIEELVGGYTVTGMTGYFEPELEIPLAKEQRVRLARDYDEAGMFAINWLHHGQFTEGA